VFSISEGDCAPRKGELLGSDEFTLTDANGDVQLFSSETFFNRYETLTLMVYLRTVPKSVSLSFGAYADWRVHQGQDRIVRSWRRIHGRPPESNGRNLFQRHL